jgi:hypothetical protein
MIMKSQEQILQSLNMLQRQANKQSGTKQAISARQVKTSRSHSKRDEHGNGRKSRQEEESWRKFRIVVGEYMWFVGY